MICKNTVHDHTMQLRSTEIKFICIPSYLSIGCHIFIFKVKIGKKKFLFGNCMLRALFITLCSCVASDSYIKADVLGILVSYKLVLVVSHFEYSKSGMLVSSPGKI